jgi:hypothetical protein
MGLVEIKDKRVDRLALDKLALIVFDRSRENDRPIKVYFALNCNGGQ